MSYDLGFWSSQHPITLSEAVQIYTELCESNTANLVPRASAQMDVSRFRDRLTKLYPELSSFSDEEIDECVWSCSFDASPVHIIVCMSYSRVGEVVPYALQVALENNLVTYDPQKDVVVNP